MAEEAKMEGVDRLLERGKAMRHALEKHRLDLDDAICDSRRFTPGTSAWKREQSWRNTHFFSVLIALAIGVAVGYGIALS